MDKINIILSAIVSLTIISIVILVLFISPLEGPEKESEFKELPEHLLSTKYSVEKCDELLEIGFYTSIVDSDEEEKHLYDMCVEIAESIDPDWECKKTVNMWELAKKDYPHFIDNTKWLADKKCGFDVSNITP